MDKIKFLKAYIIFAVVAPLISSLLGGIIGGMIGFFFGLAGVKLPLIPFFILGVIIGVISPYWVFKWNITKYIIPQVTSFRNEISTSEQKHVAPATHIQTDENDSRFYEDAYKEIENDSVDKGLWAKAFALSKGEENATRALYVEFRAKSLHAKFLENKKQVCAKEQTLELQKQKANLDQEHIIDLSDFANQVLDKMPEMAHCLKETVAFRESDPNYSESMIKHYQGRSDSWLIGKLENPKKAAPKFYGLIIEEAYRRNLNFSKITFEIPQ